MPGGEARQVGVMGGDGAAIGRDQLRARSSRLRDEAGQSGRNQAEAEPARYSSPPPRRLPCHVRRRPGPRSPSFVLTSRDGAPLPNPSLPSFTRLCREHHMTTQHLCFFLRCVRVISSGGASIDVHRLADVQRTAAARSAPLGHGDGRALSSCSGRRSVNWSPTPRSMGCDGIVVSVSSRSTSALPPGFCRAYLAAAPARAGRRRGRACRPGSRPPPAASSCDWMSFSRRIGRGGPEHRAR